MQVNKLFTLSKGTNLAFDMDLQHKQAGSAHQVQDQQRLTAQNSGGAFTKPHVKDDTSFNIQDKPLRQPISQQSRSRKRPSVDGRSKYLPEQRIYGGSSQVAHNATTRQQYPAMRGQIDGSYGNLLHPKVSSLGGNRGVDPSPYALNESLTHNMLQEPHNQVQNSYIDPQLLQLGGITSSTRGQTGGSYDNLSDYRNLFVDGGLDRGGAGQHQYAINDDLTNPVTQEPCDYVHQHEYIDPQLLKLDAIKPRSQEVLMHRGPLGSSVGYLPGVEKMIPYLSFTDEVEDANQHTNSMYEKLRPYPSSYAAFVSEHVTLTYSSLPNSSFDDGRTIVVQRPQPWSIDHPYPTHAYPVSRHEYPEPDVTYELPYLENCSFSSPPGNENVPCKKSTIDPEPEQPLVRFDIRDRPEASATLSGDAHATCNTSAAPSAHVTPIKHLPIQRTVLRKVGPPRQKGPKEFPCPICDEAFPLSRPARVHFKIAHPDLFPPVGEYDCQIEGCNKNTDTEDGMRNHTKDHHAEGYETYLEAEKERKRTHKAAEDFASVATKKRKHGSYSSGNRREAKKRKSANDNTSS